MTFEDETGQLAFIEGLGNAGFDVGASDEGHLRDDEAPTAQVFFESNGAAVDDAATAGGEILADAIFAQNRAATREIWTFDVVHQLEHAHLRLVEQSDARVQDLPQVVRRDTGGEAE